MFPDPMAPENLPKGMQIEMPDAPDLRISQEDCNYSGEIIKALKAIPNLDITVYKMDVSEQHESLPVINLVIGVSRKEG